MRQGIVLFVLMMMISSLGAGCIGERVLDRFTEDGKDRKDKKECVCDEEKIESLHIEIRSLEEQLSTDSENQELQAKLELLREDAAVLLRKCEEKAEERANRAEERTDSEREDKCYDENRQEVECEEESDSEDTTSDSERDDSDDTTREEERCYDDNRQEIECEESNESEA